MGNIWNSDLEEISYNTDHLSLVQQLSKKNFERNRTLPNNSIDFKQACDTVCKNGLWQVLMNYEEDEFVILEDYTVSKQLQF